MRLPKPLKNGDLIRIISPAGPVDEELVIEGAKRLENWGYRVEIAPHALVRQGYLAGDDKDRAEDLITALTDPVVRGIICSRGGYGTGRLLDRIPWDTIKELTPKPFIGFSDIAAIQLPLWSRSGWCSFSGPQAAFGLGCSISDRSARHLRSMLDGSHRQISWKQGEEIILQPVKGGKCQGVLIGCCLSILVSLLGTDYFPDLSGTILCLEDIEEPLYRIDRMFWQLRASGAMKSIQGIVLGCYRWHDKELADSVADIIMGIYEDQGFSIWKGLPYGHIDDRVTVPIGVDCRINEKGQMSLIENGYSK